MEFKVRIGGYKNYYHQLLNKFKEEMIIERILKKDYRVWCDKPDEIVNRLGWLESAEETKASLEEIYSLVRSIKSEGFRQVLLLGMGGSSLAPEVFSKTFDREDGYPELSILDSTDPEAIDYYNRKYNPLETLYIVSTKSGGTVETFSLMKFFYSQMVSKVGKSEAGRHFVAITDGGSGLEKTAHELGFRKIFLNNPDIGGRYSGLSFFGIVPAALTGIDIKKLLNDAIEENEYIKKQIKTPEHLYSVQLGLIIGGMSLQGRDKLTLITSERYRYFFSWIEQLIAESTGKSGKGVVPVEGYIEEDIEDYGNDRLIVILRDNDKEGQKGEIDLKISAIKAKGHPYIEISLNDEYDLGGEMLRWEYATSIAGWVLGIHPFDQPDVEAAKKLARQKVKEYSEQGKFPEEIPAIESEGISISGNIKGDTVGEGIEEFFSYFEEGDDKHNGRGYIGIHAYIFANEEALKKLKIIRSIFQKKYKSAVTVGIGPRFLHSTGQLHKGDGGKGMYIQLVTDKTKDISIPDEPTGTTTSISFGILEKAQASGDKMALIENGRKVITINIGKAVNEGLDKLISIIR